MGYINIIFSCFLITIGTHQVGFFMFLDHIIFSCKKTTSALFNALRKVRDDVQININFKRKQVALESYLWRCLNRVMYIYIYIKWELCVFNLLFYKISKLLIYHKDRTSTKIYLIKVTLYIGIVFEKNLLQHIHRDFVSISKLFFIIII